MNDHASENALFEAFAAPGKKQRYHVLLETKRGREKIRSALDHFDIRNLDPRFCRRIESGKQSLPDILRMLKSLGAPSICYVMSSDRGLDGREMDLSEALEEILGKGMGAFISCVPGKLAYFEAEEAGERYICHRER